eukprot:gnl/Hemi2/21537_TR7173_c0_g1_i1.p1 gnl/Hemi2/21537_TR7173_c0_g1~~gnl/Hemi2/21537_TR7173_c0_g1_i1.p1  ORF type:complete len:155 (-),score=60.35 gnl/Hemi2/21537_TR7173_c0_g1_i1:91-555(-)
MAATTLSREQITDYTALFNKVCGGSPSMSSDQLGTAIRSLGHNPSKARLRLIISSVDQDHSGSLALPEFLELMAKQDTHPHHNPSTVDQLKRAFKIFDKDGNGFLTVDELKEALTSFGECLTPKEVEDLMEMVDTDHTGKVDYSELAKVLIGNA